MRTKTAYNHLTRLKNRLESVYSAAMVYHPTHLQLIEQVQEVHKDPALAKCPSWVTQSLQNLDQFLFKNIQQNHVVWMFKVERGIMSYELLTDAERADVNKGLVKGEHYWIKNTTPMVGAVANPGNYKSGDTITKTFTVTDKPW